MPNFSGIWTVTQQMQAKGASTWPATPGAPTIGTASNAGATSISVAFTAPACTGYPSGGITGYRVISTPGCFSNTGASSPIVVSGLTTGTAYTFKAQAQNANGYGPLSAASNSATPAVIQGQQAYTTTGTFSWVAPTGVTSVSLVAVGAGAGGFQCSCCGYGSSGGGGGGLGYKNNYSVTPGSSYTVRVGAGTNGFSACNSSYFVSTALVKGGGGGNCVGGRTTGGTFTGDGGASGGVGTQGQGGGSSYAGAGGGAGGYSGVGGRAVGGSSCACGTTFGIAGTGSSAGGGFNRGGGGVGILGAGSPGAAQPAINNRGFGGSGGAGGGTGTASAAYGGGATSQGSPNGGSGAVRIIWPGTTRSFPSTNTGDL